MKRTEFLSCLGMGLLAVGLVDVLAVTGDLSPIQKSALEHWTLRLEQMCGDLKSREMGLAEWQRETALLLERVPLEELLRDIDFATLHNKLELPDLGVGTRYVRMPRIEGMPARASFISKLFGMRADRAIIPHGHENMASAHLVLEGQFHLRQYDKVRGDENYLWVRPTIESQSLPGHASTISDEENNVHWLIAGKKPAFTLDIIMLDLGGEEHDIFNLDMDAGKWEDGMLRCPVIGVEEALAKYGKESIHH